MGAFASICFAGAFVLAMVAIKHQCDNFIPRHGSSMGTDIVNQLIWVLFSLLTAVGSSSHLPWLFSAFVFVVGLALSVLIRQGIDRWKRHLDEKRML